MPQYQPTSYYDWSNRGHGANLTTTGVLAVDADYDTYAGDEVITTNTVYTDSTYVMYDSTNVRYLNDTNISMFDTSGISIYDSGSFTMYTSASPVSRVFTVDSTGKVGIGLQHTQPHSTAPERPVFDLHVRGTVGVENFIYHNNDTDTYILFGSDEETHYVDSNGVPDLNQTTDVNEINLRTGGKDMIQMSAQSSQNVWTDGVIELNLGDMNPADNRVEIVFTSTYHQGQIKYIATYDISAEPPADQYTEYVQLEQTDMEGWMTFVKAIASSWNTQQPGGHHSSGLPVLLQVDEPTSSWNMMFGGRLRWVWQIGRDTEQPGVTVEVQADVPEQELEFFVPNAVQSEADVLIFQPEVVLNKGMEDVDVVARTSTNSRALVIDGSTSNVVVNDTGQGDTDFIIRGEETPDNFNTDNREFFIAKPSKHNVTIYGRHDGDDYTGDILSVKGADINGYNSLNVTFSEVTIGDVNHGTNFRVKSDRYGLATEYDVIHDSNKDFDGKLAWDRNSALYIHSGTGKVGLGTDNPAATLHVNGDAQIDGNLTVKGVTNQVDTLVSVTSAIDITNSGTGPALTVKQTGTQPVMTVLDDNVTAFHIEDGGHVGINTDDPFAWLHVNAGVHGRIAQFTGRSEFSESDDLLLKSDLSGFEWEVPERPGVHSRLTTVVHAPAGIDNLLYTSWTINAANNSVYTDSDETQVGIGTDNPQAKLHVPQPVGKTIGGIDLTKSCILAGDTTRGIGIDENEIIKREGTNGGQLNIASQGSNASIKFKTGYKPEIGGAAYDRMTIDPDGNVGINTINPQDKLHVSREPIRVSHDIGANTSHTLLNFASDRTIDDYGGVNSVYWRVNLQTPSNEHRRGDLRFGAKTNILDSTIVDHVTFTHDGKVGIGTTSPDKKLTLAGNFRIEKTAVDGSDLGLDFNVGGAADHPELNIYDKDGTAGVFTVKNKNIGINTSQPSRKLDVYINENNSAVNDYRELDGIRITNSNETTGTKTALLFNTNGSSVGIVGERISTDSMRMLFITEGMDGDPWPVMSLVSNEGRVGIGTDSPETAVDIRGYNDRNTVLRVGKSNTGAQGHGAIEVTQDGMAGGGISYNGDNSPSFVNDEEADYVTFYRMSSGTRHRVMSYSYGSSTVNVHGSHVTDESYTNGWFRNYLTDKGLYNEANNNHIYSDSQKYWNMTGGDTHTGLRLRTGGFNGDVQGYLYASSSSEIGFLDAGGHWAMLHLNGTGTTFKANQEEQFKIGRGLLTGSYGTVETAGAGKDGWAGYNINGQAVFMHTAANATTPAQTGLYDDANSGWFLRSLSLGATSLYYNKEERLLTSPAGATIYAYGADSNQALLIRQMSSNGVDTGIRFVSQTGSPYTQWGEISYNHGDTSSFDHTNSFKFIGTETSTAFMFGSTSGSESSKKASLLPLNDYTGQLGNVDHRWREASIGKITIDDAIYHQADTNTYMQFQTDQIDLATNGASRVLSNNNGVVLNDNLSIEAHGRMGLDEKHTGTGAAYERKSNFLLNYHGDNIGLNSTGVTHEWSMTDAEVNNIGFRYYIKVLTMDAEGGAFLRVNSGTTRTLSYNLAGTTRDNAGMWSVFDITDDLIVGTNSVRLWTNGTDGVNYSDLYVFRSGALALDNEPVVESQIFAKDVYVHGTVTARGDYDPPGTEMHHTAQLGRVGHYSRSFTFTNPGAANTFTKYFHLAVSTPGFYHYRVTMLSSRYGSSYFWGTVTDEGNFYFESDGDFNGQHSTGVGTSLGQLELVSKDDYLVNNSGANAGREKTGADADNNNYAHKIVRYGVKFTGDSNGASTHALAVTVELTKFDDSEPAVVHFLAAPA